MRVRYYFFFLFAFSLLTFVLPHSTLAASYCDRVRGGDLNDPNLLLCEDFEAPTLTGSTGVGNGAPYYGPWYDSTGYPGNRGNNSYWTRTYSNGGDGQLWQSGQPNPATFGAPCGFSRCMTGAWDATNRWQANNFAAIGIFRDPDFSVEIPSITKPTGKAGGGSGVFDGNASLAQRVPRGDTAGITGYKNWSQVRTFGITMAVAFPNNLAASGINNDMWKFNEWPYEPGGAAGDGLFLFGHHGELNTTFPFYQFTFSEGASEATCNSRIAAAIKTAGNFGCDSAGNFLWRASSANYSRPVDWPDSTWACVEGYYQNMGTTNSSIQIWFTGPAGVRKKLVDISGMNLTSHAARNGYYGYSFNNYSNANQPGGGGPTTQAAFRYEDNIHIRKGPPVSCAQIGFQSGSPTVPNAPSGLSLQ